MSRNVETLTGLITPAVEGLGYELVGIEHLPSGKHSLLRIYIDSPQGITVDDCSRVSHQVNGVLEVEDPIKGQYTLEISSPGIDRPLFTLEQFRSFAGSKVKIRLHRAKEGKRKFTGVIEKVEDDEIYVITGEPEETLCLNIDEIDKANIIADISMG